MTRQIGRLDGLLREAEYDNVEFYRTAIKNLQAEMETLCKKNYCRCRRSTPQRLKKRDDSHRSDYSRTFSECYSVVAKGRSYTSFAGRGHYPYITLRF